MSKTKKDYAKLGISRNTPEEVTAVLRKLVKEPSTGTKPTQKKQLQLSPDMFEKISKDTNQNILDADSIFQILPDVELAEQILVGSIISPKDMSTVELDFTVDQHKFESELSRSLINIVEDHFKNDYKIDDDLSRMLEDILFIKGSHILAVLPENNIDQIINSSHGRLSTESYAQVLDGINNKTSLGILGSPDKTNPNSVDTKIKGKVTVSLEHEDRTTVKTFDTVLPGLEVTDNFELLKAPAVGKQLRKKKLSNILNSHRVSMEASSYKYTEDKINSLYQDTNGQTAQPTVVMTPQAYLDTPSVGHPIVLTLPPGAVIPVYVPGDPSDHVGCFVLLENGRPIEPDPNKDYYGEIRSNFKANTQDNSSELVRQVKEAMGGASRKDIDMEQLHEAYRELVVNDLHNRLRNGLYGESYDLDISDDVMRIMLYRSLQAKNTKLLYIPSELVVYMAFNYNKQGIGESLLTKSKIISSMRSVMLFADTMGGVRNAIGRKKASITVDPDDPDPQKTISDAQSLILESSHRGFPLGSPDPAQTLDYLHRAGFDFSINVEGDNYPSTRIEFDDYNTQINAGNQELQERLRRIQIASWGLSPEWVDPQSSPEFAVSVVNNNLLMTRRVVRYQQQFTRFLSKFIRTYTQHSSKLRALLSEELKDSKQKLAPDLRKLDDESLLDMFISSIRVTLPSPDTTRIDIQLQALEQYTNALDRALEAYITNDLFPADYLEQEPDAVNHVISTIRAYYIRMWMERNNILPELDQLIEMDGNKPAFSLLDIQKGHFSSLGKAITKYLDQLEKEREKYKKKREAREAEEESDTDDYGSDSIDEVTDEGGESDDTDVEDESESTDELDELDDLDDNIPDEGTLDELDTESDDEEDLNMDEEDLNMDEDE